MNTATILDYAYFNFAHGGSTPGTPCVYNMDGLVEALGDGGRWPDVAVLGEADYWGYFGEKGSCEAEVALNLAAPDRAYVVKLGTLPRQWGDIAPALVYDANRVLRYEWHSGREPGFEDRNRNLAVLAPRAAPHKKINTFGTHGARSGLQRFLDVDRFAPYGTTTSMPTVVLADFFTTLSGPHFEPKNYHEYFSELVHYAPRMLFPNGVPMPGEHPFDTLALEFLCGAWRDGRRIGGSGFRHVGEMAGVFDPTNYPAPNGRPCTQIDGAVLNPAAARMLVPGSVKVHRPQDPDKPPSDHMRFSFQLDLDRKAFPVETPAAAQHPDPAT